MIMRHGIKRTAVLLLSAIIVASSTAMQSCSLVKINLPEPPRTSGEERTDVPPIVTPIENKKDYAARIEEFFSELPSESYNGEDILIMSSLDRGLLLSDDTPFISSAVNERNKKVEERFGVKLAEIVEDKDTMRDKAAAAYASDAYYADIMLIPGSYVGSYTADGTLMNLRSVPFLDLTKEYFNQSSVAASSVGYMTSAVAGPASFDRDSLVCMYFSTYRTSQLETGDLYESVKNGDWTWDRFFEITSGFGEYNDARAKLGNSLISSYSAESLGMGLADAVFASCGKTYIDSAVAAEPTVSPFLEKGSYVLEYAKRLVSDPFKYDALLGSREKFAGGTLAFMIDTLGAAKEIRDSEYGWGILPLPKSGDSVGYNSYQQPADIRMFALMRNSLTPEKSGTILSALNAASWGELDYAYVKHMANFYLRDNESANMADIIISGTLYDGAALFYENSPRIFSGTYGIAYSYAYSEAISDGEWNDRLRAVSEALAELSK